MKIAPIFFQTAIKFRLVPEVLSLTLDEVDAKALGKASSSQFSEAAPFPHIVFDNFLPEDIIERVNKSWPDAPQRGDINFNNQVFVDKKKLVMPWDCALEIRELFNFFNSSAFIIFLEALTGIDGLIPDPHFFGGGLHEIRSGGRLGVHADYRINKKLRLVRRLNLILYFNKGWSEDYGGSLELWDRKITRKIKSISPISNRVVIFETDSESFHGHPEPLNTPDDVTRKSMALYYFTASESVFSEVGDRSTVFKSNTRDKTLGLFFHQIKSARYESILRQILPPIIYRGLKKMKSTITFKN
jgi:hypothetical protein